MEPKHFAKRTSPSAARVIVPDDGVDLDRTPRPIAWRVRDLAAGHVVARHRHRRAQLLYASRGVMTAVTDGGVWVVPPQRAVWVPADLAHEVRANNRLHLRSLYFDPGTVDGLPDRCTVVTVTPLLRELILAAVRLDPLYDPDGADGRLLAVIVDQLRVLPAVPLYLPRPAEPRLRKVTDAIEAAPGDRRTLEDWARAAGASGRTLARRFVSETGMTFGQWRQQARLLAALARLADGEPVNRVALDLGYDSQSAFITMFRRALGTTPGRYFARARDGTPP
jgi:AraC-like DNA-binding protein/quercetin dioxygenase-like cupin family protein